jgi:hypothetical protein
MVPSRISASPIRAAEELDPFVHHAVGHRWQRGYEQNCTRGLRDDVREDMRAVRHP